MDLCEREDPSSCSEHCSGVEYDAMRRIRLPRPSAGWLAGWVKASKKQKQRCKKLEKIAMAFIGRRWVRWMRKKRAQRQQCDIVWTLHSIDIPHHSISQHALCVPYSNIVFQLQVKWMDCSPPQGSQESTKTTQQASYYLLGHGIDCFRMI